MICKWRPYQAHNFVSPTIYEVQMTLEKQYYLHWLHPVVFSRYMIIKYDVCVLSVRIYVGCLLHVHWFDVDRIVYITTHIVKYAQLIHHILPTHIS